MLEKDHAGIPKCAGLTWLRSLRAAAEIAARRGRSIKANAAKDQAVFARVCRSHGQAWWLPLAQVSGRMEAEAIAERRGTFAKANTATDQDVLAMLTDVNAVIVGIEAEERALNSGRFWN